MVVTLYLVSSTKELIELTFLTHSVQFYCFLFHVGQALQSFWAYSFNKDEPGAFSSAFIDGVMVLGIIWVICGHVTWTMCLGLDVR